MFKNREDAAKKLALKIKRTLREKDYQVVGIVRGGIILAKIIGDYLNTSLHSLVIRKIGAPYNREFAIGAVGLAAGVPVGEKIVYWDEDLIERLNIGSSYRLSALKEKTREVERLEKIFSFNRKGLSFRDKRVMLVDDGVATGTSVLCAQKILKKQRPKELILATPVISKESFEHIKKYFDNVIALEKPLNFSAVGQFYKDFPQVEDKEVVALMSS